MSNVLAFFFLSYFKISDVLAFKEGIDPYNVKIVLVYITKNR